MVQEVEQEFKGSVVDMAIQEYTDAKGIRRIVGNPAVPVMRKIVSSQKVGLEIIGLQWPRTRLGQYHVTKFYRTTLRCPGRRLWHAPEYV